MAVAGEVVGTGVGKAWAVIAALLSEQSSQAVYGSGAMRVFSINASSTSTHKMQRGGL